VKMSSPLVAVIILVVVAGGIALASGMGLWQTESSKVPARYTSGEAEGQYNPADIRGSYTLSDVSEAFGIPVEVLAQAFGLEQEGAPATLQVKILEEEYGQIGELEIGTDSMRLFVARYLGLPITAASDTGLPQPAAAILTARGTLTPEEEEELRARTVTLPAASERTGAEPEDGEDSSPAAGDAAPATAAADAAPAEDHEDAEETSVKGKTTFGELLSWGVSRADIEQLLGAEMGPGNMAIRDYCANAGIEFSTIKDALQQLVDRAGSDM